MHSPDASLPEEFGRYRIRRKLGAGAMGTVYVADDTQLMRQVAIKIPQLKPDGFPDLLERFHREARTAATLRNSHICPVYDVGVIDGQHFISMTFIEGKTLAEVSRSNARITERQILILVRKLAQALQDAHQHGIVHRDLKPANIMIDTRGEPVVMDFGLAFQTQMPSERLTVDGHIVGSPAYMSPEQLSGDTKTLTPAVDQYALGVTLYELLTKQLPFQGSFASIINQIINQPPPSPRQLRPNLDPQIDELCLKLMAKNPEQRFPSMQDVADRVTAILKSESRVDTAKSPIKPAADVINGSPDYFDKIQQRIAALIEKAELREALDVVKDIAQMQDAEPREWARQMQKEISSKIQERKGQLNILANVAAKLIREHDYAEAVNVLSSIPEAERTEEVQDLLGDAENKAEETNLLMNDIQQAIANDQPKELAPVIRRYLQLKPGNAAVRSLADDLKKYGPEELIRIRRRRQNYFDPAPPLFQPMHLVYALGGISGLALAVYAWTLFYLVPSGTVVVDVFDARISINFLNHEITSSSSGQQFALRSSDQQRMSFMIDGNESTTREINVANREIKRLAARIKDDKLDLQISSNLPNFTASEKDSDGESVSRTAPASLGQLPTTSPDQFKEERFDLMSESDLNAMSSPKILWKRADQKLIGTLVENSDSGWLWKISQRKVSGDFDLEVDFLVVGSNFVDVGLPLKDTVGHLKIGKQGTALHWIDGKDTDWKKNGPPVGNKEMRLKPDTRHQLSVSVRHAGNDVSVDAKLDGEVVCQLKSSRSRISIPKIEVPTPDHVKLVTELSKRNDSRLEIHRFRVRDLGPGLPDSSPNLLEMKSDTSTTATAPRPSKASRIIIDADFAKSNGGFNNLDVHHILSEHKDSEYRYVGKKTGWWWNGIEPAVGKKENRQLDDFNLEFALRMVGKKKGWFVVRFGLAQKDQLSLCIDETGRIRLLRGTDVVLVAPTLPRNLKPIDQFNAVQLSVENKTVRVTVNDEQVFEKRLEQYVGRSVRIWLAPDEVPFDVRLNRVKLQTSTASPPSTTKELRKLVGHKKSIRAVQFLPGNEQAVSVSDDKSFKIWNVATGKVIHELQGHRAEVSSVSVSEDGRRALTGCADGLVRFWDLETRQVVKTLKGHTRPITSVVLARDSKMAWAAADDGTIRAWDLRTSAGSKLIAGPGTGTTIEVSSNEKSIAAGNSHGQVHIQAASGGCSLAGHSAGTIGGIAFTPDDGKVITASDDGTLRLWGLNNCKEIHRFAGAGASFKSVRITSNGRYAIAGNLDWKIYVFDLQTGDAIYEIRADRSVNQLLTLSADNRQVLTAGDDDHDLHLWQLPNIISQGK